METMNRQELLLCTLWRQFLLEKGTKQEVVSALQGLQAQFATNPATALRIRTADFSQASWTQGLIKIWSHRGTIHVVGQGEVGLFLSARGQRQPWTDAPWGLSAKEKVHWAMFIRQQVELGTTQREALKQVCRQAGMGQPLVEKVFYGWGGLIKEMCDERVDRLSKRNRKKFCTAAGGMDGNGTGEAHSIGTVFPDLWPCHMGGLRLVYRVEDG